MVRCGCMRPCGLLFFLLSRTHALYRVSDVPAEICNLADPTEFGGERCGYQMNLAPIAARKLAMETVYHWAIGPAFALLGRSVWRPFRASRFRLVPRVKTLG
jgi:hypothetical protein